MLNKISISSAGTVHSAGVNLAVFWTIIVSVNLVQKMWLVVHCGIYNASESNFFVCVCVFAHCSWQHGIQFMA